MVSYQEGAPSFLEQKSRRIKWQSFPPSCLLLAQQRPQSNPALTMAPHSNAQILPFITGPVGSGSKKGRGGSLVKTHLEGECPFPWAGEGLHGPVHIELGLLLCWQWQQRLQQQLSLGSEVSLPVMKKSSETLHVM